LTFSSITEMTIVVEHKIKLKCVQLRRDSWQSASNHSYTKAIQIHIHCVSVYHIYLTCQWDLCMVQAYALMDSAHCTTDIATVSCITCRYYEYAVVMISYTEILFET